jgi:hypothetical protein
MPMRYELPATGEFTITVSYHGELNPVKDQILKKALGRGFCSSGMFLGSRTHPRQRDISRTFKRRVAGERALKKCLQLKKAKGMFKFKIQIAW